jgi:hypothetical protein
MRDYFNFSRYGDYTHTTPDYGLSVTEIKTNH